MCGPSPEQKQIAGEQGGFFNTLMQSYNTNFANQQGILSSITSALSPILQGGPSQMGFSPQETAALNSSAINNTAAQFRNASVAAGQAGAAGGNTGVTTGGQAQLQAGIASGAGQALGGELNNIQLASAEQGRNNFFTAENALAGNAAQYSPVSYAGQATNAGAAGFGEATIVRNMANQEQADIGGLVSSIPGMVAGGIGFANGNNFLSGLAGGNLFGPGSFFGGGSGGGGGNGDYYGNQG